MKNQYETNQIELIAYSFKDSLDQDMKDADLIICHAGLPLFHLFAHSCLGAGSITEALSLKKKVMV
jgi:UDP-N-acetylglucosamine transferase subunit ALG13